MQHSNSNPNLEETTKSSGMIRGAIIGAILLLAVYGLVSVVAKFTRSAHGGVVQTAQIDHTDDTGKFDALVAEWAKAKAAWQNDVKAEKTVAGRLTDTQASLAAHEAVLKEVELTFSQVAESVVLSTVKAERAEDEIAVLLDDNLETKVAHSVGYLETVQANKATEETKYKTAKAEADRIRSAVDKLRSASIAAKAAAKASANVANAADAAQIVVDQNEDVMPDGDGSTLLNLRNDFFNEAKSQADAADRSARAAAKAAAVSGKELDKAEARAADHLKTVEQITAEEIQAKKELEKLAKQLEDLQKQRSSVRKKSAIAHERLLNEKAKLEKKKTALAEATVKNEALKTDFETLKKEHEAAKTKVSVTRHTFETTESELRLAQKARAKNRAAKIAGLNSEMHDKLRITLGNLNIENPHHDRFIVPSEALFPSGSAKLGEAGQRLIVDIADVIRSVTDQMPENSDWILRVDGHTDATPFNGNGSFKDNWELSQARALAVVRYMVTKGNIAPERLAANGLGEYQPLKAGDGAKALAENRRIELALVPR